MQLATVVEQLTAVIVQTRPTPSCRALSNQQIAMPTSMVLHRGQTPSVTRNRPREMRGKCSKTYVQRHQSTPMKVNHKWCLTKVHFHQILGLTLFWPKDRFRGQKITWTRLTSVFQRSVQQAAGHHIDWNFHKFSKPLTLVTSQESLRIQKVQSNPKECCPPSTTLSPFLTVSLAPTCSMTARIYKFCTKTS